MGRSPRNPRNPRNRRLAAGLLAALAVAVSAGAAPAVADPADPYVDPYIDKYGAEICQAMDRNPTHDEVLKAIATVRDYTHLSDEDAEIVVVDSVSRLCPRYVDLIGLPAR